MCSVCGYDMDCRPCANCGCEYEECECGHYEPMTQEDFEEGA